MIVGKISCNKKGIDTILTNCKQKRRIPSEFSYTVKNRFEMLLKSNRNKKPHWMPSNYNGMWTEYGKEKYSDSGSSCLWEYYIKDNDNSIYFVVLDD